MLDLFHNEYFLYVIQLIIQTTAGLSVPGISSSIGPRLNTARLYSHNDLGSSDHEFYKKLV
jgi:hypothetical protein